MKKMMFALVVIIIVVTATGVFPVNACLRCPTNDGGSDLACTGQSKVEVTSKCGPPDSTESRDKVISNGPNFETKRIDSYFYNCGEGRFIQRLDFEDGILVSITNSGRGSGPQKCD